MVFAPAQGSGSSSGGGGGGGSVATTPLTVQPEAASQAASFAYMPPTVGLQLGMLTLEEPTGADPAVAIVRAGAGVLDPVIGYFTLNPLQSTVVAFDPLIDVSGGIYVELVAGTVSISAGTVVGDSTPLVMQPEQANKVASFQYMPATANLRLGAITLREPTVVDVATVVVRLGTLDTDPVAAYYELLAGESDRTTYFPDLDASAGIRVQIIAGTVSISVGTRTAA